MARKDADAAGAGPGTGPGATFRGRGAGINPPNRFEPLHVERDDWTDPDDPGPETVLLRDHSRTILACNNSPDVPFTYSINPYRGCEHGCTYCLAPDTPVLYADFSWQPLGEVRPGDVLAGFDEYPRPGKMRRFRKAVVEDVWWSKRPTVRLVSRHSDVVTTSDHRWLDGSSRWTRTQHLSRGRELRYLPVVDGEDTDDDYRLGYITALTLGDGTFRYIPGQRSDKLGFPPAYWRIALVDEEPLLRTARYLREFGIDVGLRPFPNGDRAPLQKIETRALSNLATLHSIMARELPSRAYRRGFLAGFFDAEGHAGTSLRMFQVDESVLGRVQRYASSLGFRFQLERYAGKRASSIRLVGNLVDRLRFFSICRPAIVRKAEALFGRHLTLNPDPVEAVEDGPEREVVDIRTSTGTFYAAGLATHNCYARPGHEFLGMSAGLDFETRIVVKENAPDLLRRELASPRWNPQVLAISGVTDAYQPVERRLRLTRGCLEVLAEARNPVSVITKSHLVTRDADLLSELAGHRAAAVTLSITTLDAELQRKLEPRAASPTLRLKAVEALAGAEIPVGVNVAPVIPGLTDHEIPAILEAAAAAGASSASWIMLRLPHGVKEIFLDWLDRHVPDRKRKVVNRIRELRDGALNDAEFGTRMRGQGRFAEMVADLFEVSRRRAGLQRGVAALSTAAFRRPASPPRDGDGAGAGPRGGSSKRRDPGAQLELFS